MSDLPQRPLPLDRLVVAIDPGNAQNRVWLSTDTAGLLVEPAHLTHRGTGILHGSCPPAPKRPRNRL